MNRQFLTKLSVVVVLNIVLINLIMQYINVTLNVHNPMHWLLSLLVSTLIVLTYDMVFNTRTNTAGSDKDDKNELL